MGYKYKSECTTTSFVSGFVLNEQRPQDVYIPTPLRSAKCKSPCTLLFVLFYGTRARFKQIKGPLNTIQVSALNPYGEALK